jgi:hypothetical protein
MDRQFDQQIKKALEGYQVPYDGHSWEDLESRLVQEGLVKETESVDEIAKQVLSDMEVPYNPSTWHILTEKLELLDYNRKLISVKFIEAALILFAFLTVVRYTATHDQVLNDTGMAAHIAPSATQENATPQITPNTSEKEILAYRENEEATVANNIGSDQPVSDRSSRFQPVAPVTSLLKELVLFPAVITRSEVPLIEEFNLIQEQSFSQPGIVAGLEPLPRDYDPLEASPDLIARQADYLTYTLPPLNWPGERKLQTKIGFYSQGNIHRVFTPALFSQNRINESVAMSPGVGFVTSVQIGNAGFDFGLVYERLTFQGILDKNLIHKAAIPVHLKLIPLSVESINMYVKGGGSLHGVMNAFYEEPTFASRSNQLSDLEKFNDGLLNEGLTDNNVYVTANVGIGLERAIYRDIFFFGEALYQRQILGQGIGGATRNTFRTLSLNLGINYTIR